MWLGAAAAVATGEEVRARANNASSSSSSLHYHRASGRLVVGDIDPDFYVRPRTRSSVNNDVNDDEWASDERVVPVVLAASARDAFASLRASPTTTAPVFAPILAFAPTPSPTAPLARQRVSTSATTPARAVHAHAQVQASKVSTSAPSLSAQQIQLDALSPSGAWASTTDDHSATVRVYVLDTGCSATHPTIASHDVVFGPAFAPGSTRVDTYGHGTFVASLVLSVVPSARVVCVKVFDDYGGGTTSTVAQGMLFAANDCAKDASSPCVVNLSGGTRIGSTVLRAIANDLVDKYNVLGAYAAGNYVGATCTFSPADAALAISAGSVSVSVSPQLAFSFAFDSFSASGPCVSVFAPGSGVVGADARTGGLTIMDGTSMSTGFVSGAAAAARAREPTMRADEVRAWLTDLARRGIVRGVPPNTPNAMLTVPIDKTPLFTELWGSSTPDFVEWRNAWAFDSSTSACMTATSPRATFVYGVSRSTDRVAHAPIEVQVGGTTANVVSFLESGKAIARVPNVATAVVRTFAVRFVSHLMVRVGVRVTLGGTTYEVAAHDVPLAGAGTGTVYTTLARADYTNVTFVSPCDDSAVVAARAGVPCAHRTTAVLCTETNAVAELHADGTVERANTKPCVWSAGSCVARHHCAYQTRATCFDRHPVCKWVAGQCKHV